MPPTVIAIANQKGGVGKTTTTINLGRALADLAGPTLMIDLDPQASLTVLLGIDATSGNMADVLGMAEKGTGDIAAIVRPVASGLDIAPSDIMLSRTELGLVVRGTREHQLAKALGSLGDRYRHVLIDCPPSLGLLTLNALVAAAWAIVPTQLSMMDLRGLSLFIETLGEVRSDYGQSARLMGVLPTRAEQRTLHGREVLEALRQQPALRVFAATVPESVKFKDAAGHRQSLIDYDARHAGAAAYQALAAEVVARE
jgi:chromosome partitioning protein